jgi:tetratricopeptide (TPR) repeat protein
MGEANLAFVGYSAVDPIAALEAEKQFQKRLENPENVDDADLNEALACVKDILGKKDQAIRMREEFVAKHPLSKDFMLNVGALRYLAFGYVGAGDRERALQTFAKLVQVPHGIWYGPLKYDPVLESLRADSRFDEILQQSQQPFPRLTVTDSH